VLLLFLLLDLTAVSAAAPTSQQDALVVQRQLVKGRQCVRFMKRCGLNESQGSTQNDTVARCGMVVVCEIHLPVQGPGGRDTSEAS
jgi:hypothetical protein